MLPSPTGEVNSARRTLARSVIELSDELPHIKIVAPNHNKEVESGEKLWITRRLGFSKAHDPDKYSVDYYINANRPDCMDRKVHNQTGTYRWESPSTKPQQPNPSCCRAGEQVSLRQVRLRRSVRSGRTRAQTSKATYSRHGRRRVSGKTVSRLPGGRLLAISQRSLFWPAGVVHDPFFLAAFLAAFFVRGRRAAGLSNSMSRAA